MFSPVSQLASLAYWKSSASLLWSSRGLLPWSSLFFDSVTFAFCKFFLYTNSRCEIFSYSNPTLLCTQLPAACFCIKCNNSRKSITIRINFMNQWKTACFRFGRGEEWDRVVTCGMSWWMSWIKPLKSLFPRPCTQLKLAFLRALQCHFLWSWQMQFPIHLKKCKDSFPCLLSIPPLWSLPVLPCP